MMDLAVGILTYKGSKWDALALCSKLDETLSKSGISFQVVVFDNKEEFRLKPLTPLQYLCRVLRIHNEIFVARIKRAASLRVFSWFLRQQGATIISLLKLLSSKHRIKIAKEAMRAASISGGHQDLLRALSKFEAKLFLVLEDDVQIDSRAGLASLIRGPLMQLNPTKNAFSCDLSLSFTFRELGVDDGDSLGGELRRHKYAFTNTLAATVVSAKLLEATLAELSRDTRVSRVQFDYELVTTWTASECRVMSYSSQAPMFRQMSNFSDIKFT